MITGAGTSRSIASATVQRPSPLSETYGAMPSIPGFSASARAVRSRSHDRTTLPLRQSSAICARSSANSCLCLRIEKPSAYACIIPYSIPLCTIFVKWPAPVGPTCPHPWSFAGASVSKMGRRRFTASADPPTMRLSPSVNPQMPPLVPASTNRTPRSATIAPRRIDSL